jgi:hypothetical protein
VSTIAPSLRFQWGGGVYYFSASDFSAIFFISKFTIHNSKFPIPAGSQTRLSPKLFSLLQIALFRFWTPFTQSLQGFFCGPKPLFLPCIYYPRWPVTFSIP